MNLSTKLNTLGLKLASLSNHLASLGYVFDNPDEVFPGVEPDVEKSILRIESEVGEIPLAIKLFWRCIGSIDLCGEHPDWVGCEYPDPLVVFPASYAVMELEEFLEDKQERLRLGYPYVIPVAPDYFHKSNVSGGMFYNVSVPAIADNPPLNDEHHDFTFIDYLELAIANGGFSGLADEKNHNWPVEKLLLVM